MSKRKLPEHIPGTVEHWRKKKRRELRVIREAMATFQLGCAYTPAYLEFCDALSHIEKVHQMLRGRWQP